MMTTTTIAMIFVGEEKFCVQSMWAWNNGGLDCGCRSQSTVAPLILSRDVGHIVVTMDTPDHAFLFLYGHDMNEGGLGGRQRLWGRTWTMMTWAEGNEVGEGLPMNNYNYNQPSMGLVQSWKMMEQVADNKRMLDSNGGDK
jgi:hypothetical protein